MRALMCIQRRMRGWKERVVLARERAALKKRVLVIEDFVCNWFQPWQRRQQALLQQNLERIVVVQSKIRRFIAIKHSQERRKVKHAFAVMGAWQLLYWLLLLLLLCATINERSGGALNDYLHAADAHFFPQVALLY